MRGVRAELQTGEIQEGCKPARELEKFEPAVIQGHLRYPQLSRAFLGG